MTTTTRTAVSVGVLVVEAGLAASGVLLHDSLTTEYGDIAASAVEGWLWGFTAGTGGLALVLVGVLAVVALLVSRRRWVRRVALGIPVLMVLGMLMVTPGALQEKREVQFDATPQCVSQEDDGSGPGARAQRRSQEAFDSIDHVGYFGGGGASGVGGCDRRFVLTERVDPLGHYRVALPAAGWRVVEDHVDHLRAVRGDLAFDLVVWEGGGVVWAGTRHDGDRPARPDRPPRGG